MSPFRPSFSPEPKCIRNPNSPLSTFKMNTCKSVSKQRTLSASIMNTYAKTGGGGLLLTSHGFSNSLRQNVSNATSHEPAFHRSHPILSRSRLTAHEPPVTPLHRYSPFASHQ